MSKYNLLLAGICIFTLLSSCQPHEKRESPSFTVKNSTFEDCLTIDGFVESDKTTTIVCPRDVDGVVVYVIEDGAVVKQGDVVCIIEDKELQKNYSESSVNLENAKAEMNRSKADLDLQYSLLEAQVKNNTAETEIANLDSLQLQYLSPTQRRIKKLELEKVSIEKSKLKHKLESLAIINQSEIRKLEMEIQRITNWMQNSKERIDALTIKAPQDGMVTRAVHYITNKKIQVSDPVWNNMPIVIIPDLSKMKAKIYASEGDYKRINVNDGVEFTFDAMPKNKAWGKILKKSPVGQPVKQDSKVKIFEIETSIDKSLVIPGQGLTANCKVILKRINDTIVIPQITIFEEDSMKVVYVKKGEKYEMRQVLTGTTSPKSAVIVSGLHRKEVISFIKPKSSLVEKKTLLPKSILKKFGNIKPTPSV